MFFRCLPIALTKERTNHEGAKYHDRGRPNTIIMRLHTIVFLCIFAVSFMGSNAAWQYFPTNRCENDTLNENKRPAKGRKTMMRRAPRNYLFIKNDRQHEQDCKTNDGPDW
ncbi:hypothetical protein CJ231_01885 [Hoylesella buccalis]|uniref:Uncharacterized protein n=1 Tax=Hoylesella buccalis TaxID=28127 RepID=A0A2N6QU32_9BACT|nr:hypothetical protein CJ231_01885 [Hoylesella buccalis]